MLFDSITLLQGATIQNATIDVGTTFPAVPDAGELFFRSDESLLYVYTGTAWQAVGTGTNGSGGGNFTVAGDVAGSITNGSGTLELATITTDVGTFGSDSKTLTITTDAKGRVLGVSETPISITPSQISTTIPIVKGGTGATTASQAINALVPSQTNNSGRYLKTNGSTVSWDFPTGGTVTSVNVIGGATGLTTTGGPITTSGVITLGGVLTVANGGTGATTAQDAWDSLVPNQSGKAGQFLSTSGETSYWQPITSGIVTGALGFTPLNKAGDTVTGTLTLSADPQQPLHAATKRYVDNLVSGVAVLDAVRTSTDANLTATYNNGTAGVGAKLIGTGLLPAIGGVSDLTIGDRILVKDQNDAIQNGIYEVLALSPDWQLVRPANYDNHVAKQINAGDTVFVQEGVLSGTQWVMNTTGMITVGNSAISWTQFGGPGSYGAGVGIGLSNNVISNTGVLSITAGANLKTTSATGAVTLELDGTIPFSHGGTGATTRQDAINSLVGSVASNRVLIGNGTNVQLGQINLSTDAVTSVLPVTHGGTGATTASQAINNLVPGQAGQAGKFLATDGANLTWVGISVQGTGGSLQFNNNGGFDGTAQISYNSTDTLTVGQTGSTFTLSGALGALGTVVKGGISEGGNSESARSSTLTLSGGTAVVYEIWSTDTQGNPVLSSTIPSISGGHVVIAGGTSQSNLGGHVFIKTAQGSTLVDRLEVTNKGVWKINGQTGTAGQILTSNGENVAPSWQTPTFNGTVTSVGIDTTTTGLTSSAAITTSGNIQLGGVLAVEHGGTGVTTAAEALTTFLPSQAQQAGKVLTTNGTSVSWQSVGLGSVTSINASGGSTGLTFTGGPITQSGTLTLSGTLSIAAGGTGKTSFAAGYVKSDGTELTSTSTIDAADVVGNLAGTATNVTGIVAIANGGTGASTAEAARNAIMPAQIGKAGKYLKTDGTSITWSSVNSVEAAGGQDEVQFNDGGITSASSAVKITSDVLVLTNDATVNGLTVGLGNGIGELVNDPQNPGQQIPKYTNNTAFGKDVLASSIHSTDNTGFGFSALKSVANSTDNTAVGSRALELNTAGGDNTAIGSNALKANTEANSNTAVGSQSAQSVTTGGNNTSIGAYSLNKTTLGGGNTALGDHALYLNTEGNNNTAVGINALSNNVLGSSSTAVGKNALFSSYSQNNTAVGDTALYSLTSGQNNVALGKNAGSSITTGNNNTIIGNHTGEAGISDTIIIAAGTTQRLRINNSGAYSFGDTNTYGTAGQTLVSNGANAAPTWQTPPSGTVSSVDISGGTTGLTFTGGPITTNGTFTTAGTLAIANGGTGATTAEAALTALLPTQTGNSGKYLLTDGTAASWASTPPAAAGSLTGTTLASNVVSSSLTSLGTLTSLTVNGSINASANSGTALLINATTPTGTGVSITATNPMTGVADGTPGPGITITAGRDIQGGAAGSVVITAGPGGGNGSTGGNVHLRAGGLLNINGSTGGALIFSTAGFASETERFRILNNGAWSVGSTGSATGATGQVLTSNGAGSAPTWQTPASALPSQTGNSGRYLTTDGTTASWAAVQALPSQTGNSGRVLTTDGTNSSWTNTINAVSFGTFYDESSVTQTASASTSINCATANNFILNMSASITNLEFSNIPLSGRVYNLTLYIVQDATGGRTILWPATIRWPGGTAPTLTAAANKTDVITLVTYNAGTTWLGFVAGQNF